jgi:hypothetical protein
MFFTTVKMLLYCSLFTACDKFCYFLSNIFTNTTVLENNRKPMHIAFPLFFYQAYVK